MATASMTCAVAAGSSRGYRSISESIQLRGSELRVAFVPRQGKAMASVRKTRECTAMAAGNANGGGLTYKDAGVDIDAGTELVRRIAKMTPGIGGFGGLYSFGDSFLVAGTDGVGTKLKLAFDMDKHDTIGIDLVAMSVNDIITSGATPMFFLDYFATSHLDVDQAEQVIKGIVDGCKQSGCALLGGETAEMPGFYAPGEYDLSGFAVGSVKKDALIDGKSIVAGDILLGLPSSGVHSNGFSLARKVLAKSGSSLHDELPGAGISIGEALLVPTTIYVKQVLDLVAKGGIKGIAHITGGGFTDNIPRVFPKGLGVEIDAGSWEVPPIFKWLQEQGGVDDAEMRRTFNMGIGMVLIVNEAVAERILSEANPDAKVYRLGHIIEGEGVVFK
ncbi:phosphoribosylformylglycinamidine cyclo-ligase, chloroplastic/mitochondrial [Physcomitrium patens]|uniref:phosphoribosylformylglycinamidine cyclo-ligase n=1 Tax=Physcomitrium patens TaxID=3218 RepID=A0A2K1KH55_PHYPA|nr:phosphoribosylformylglycinamidine cyclo-ligase, chloroplastic/mitochondrial-like [Physcomitrium patens]PNR53108.1 hypothetical protein PHYPA_009483 [Physcomitrium patens]|eukprot:XP_024379321.1 phosphoribosylformylglycinamidine cyclo-ligase, chloroplastic/mitochondrial-like [Physcomitrella patens]